jgi:D-3-phosphoglycerate dehydrogenase
MQADICLIVQPIHEDGIASLERSGLRIRHASATDAATLAAEAADCIAVVTRSAGFPNEAIACARRLRVIGVHGSGTDAVAVRDATRAGIAVVNTPGANARSVAEQAIALTFAVLKDVIRADRSVRQGDRGYKYGAAVRELSGLAMGLVGLGATGKETARLAKALGMDVVAFGPTRPEDDFIRVGARRANSLDVLLREVDVVSLHLSLNDLTRGIIGRAQLGLMKPDAVLINTARGALVDEMALADALAQERLHGAGLDVFSGEHLPGGHPLLIHPRVVFSPHLGGSSQAALARTARAVAEGIKDMLAGERPASLVNPEVWPLRRDG